MPGIWGGVNPILKEMSVNLASGTGITLTVGHAYIAAINYNNGADIEAALTGDAWDDLMDINLSEPFEFNFEYNYAYHPLYLKVGSDETNGDYVRIQVEIDDVVVVDFTNTSNAVDNIINYLQDLISGSITSANVFSHKMFCNSRLRVRAYKHGTFDGTSSLYIGSISYNKLQ